MKSVEYLCTVAYENTETGEEIETEVRGYVSWEYDGGPHAELDGDPEVLVDGKWITIDHVECSQEDRDRMGEALLEACAEDDSSQCVEPG